MNERIKKLALQAGYKPLGTFADELMEIYNEKFAELIVRECVNKVRSRQMFADEDAHIAHHAFDLLVYDIESHFGVEE